MAKKIRAPGWQHSGGTNSIVASRPREEGERRRGCVAIGRPDGVSMAFLIPEEFAQHARRPEMPARYFTARLNEFRILDYVEVRCQSGRNWIARCPSCTRSNRDMSGDNLAISIEEPRKYICWAGCTKEMIREALGRPIPLRRYA